MLDHAKLRTRGATSEKGVLHIQTTPTEEHFKWDGGLDLPVCWTAVMRRQEDKQFP